MRNLSREELRGVTGGVAPASCTEQCGSGSNVVSCTSDVGSCSRGGNPAEYITCDGHDYTCPPESSDNWH